ncbi:MAG: hypothetical protein KDE33_23770 [Bacteroidetes bacterium]|nr:hypothetical protein [Bacteroidota bacterium]
MNGRTFDPYIGTQYERRKFLVLGESHYANEFLTGEMTPELMRIRSNFTNCVMHQYLDFLSDRIRSQRWMNTFTKFSNVLHSQRLSKTIRIQFWESVSFYNYVQFPVSGPGQSPSKEQFEMSHSPFLQTCLELKPEMIFIWGFRLRDNLPPNSFETRIGRDEVTLYYLRAHENIPCLIVPHPSSRSFNYKISSTISKYLDQFGVKL